MCAESVMKDPNEVLMEKRADLIKNGVWSDNKEPRIYNFAPNTPHIFGRVKDHKEPPIITLMVNKKEAPTYDLEKYMKSLNKNLFPDSTAALTSKTDFIKKLRELKVEKEDILVSFSIENMYPSVDKEEIMKIVNRKIKEKFGMNKISETLICTSTLVINWDHFVFDNVYYR